MEAKVLSVKKTGAESKVSIGEALPHQVGGNSAEGISEKHDSKKASKDGIVSMNAESKQALPSE